MKKISEFIKGFSIQDEFIVNTRNKIASEVLNVVMLMAALSLVIKLFVLEDSLKSGIFEVAIVLFALVYSTIRAYFLGSLASSIELSERKHKTPSIVRNIMGAGVFGIGMGLFFGIRSAVLYGSEGKYVLYFVIVFIASVTIYTSIALAIALPYTFMTYRLVNKAKHDEE